MASGNKLYLNAAALTGVFKGYWGTASARGKFVTSRC